MNKLTFNPVISFDGVAIITACITFTLWFGALNSTVKEHTEYIKHLTLIQETQSEALKVVAQNIAVLQSIVNERTHK